MPLATITAKPAVRFLFYNCHHEARTLNLEKTVVQNLDLVQKSSLRDKLLHASVGMIFRYSRFCKERIVQKEASSRHKERKSVTRIDYGVRTPGSGEPQDRNIAKICNCCHSALVCVCCVMKRVSAERPSDSGEVLC
jgi:hypothetical protein